MSLLEKISRGLTSAPGNAAPRLATRLRAGLVARDQATRPVLLLKLLAKPGRVRKIVDLLGVLGGGSWGCKREIVGWDTAERIPHQSGDFIQGKYGGTAVAALSHPYTPESLIADR